MRDAAVGFQCPDCVKEASKGTRQNRAMYGGERSADPRLTSFVLIGINAVVWLAITGHRWSHLVADRPAGAATRRGVRPGRRLRSTTSRRRVCEASGATFLPGFSDGAWWQLVTAAFTHVEIWHLAMNMLALFILGPALEGIVGRARFLAIYLISAARRLGRWWCGSPRVHLHRRCLRSDLRPAGRPARHRPQGPARLAVDRAEPRPRRRHHRRSGGATSPGRATSVASSAERWRRRSSPTRPASRRALVQWIGLALLLAVLARARSLVQRRRPRLTRRTSGLALPRRVSRRTTSRAPRAGCSTGVHTGVDNYRRVILHRRCPQWGYSHADVRARNRLER